MYMDKSFAKSLPSYPTRRKFLLASGIAPPMIGVFCAGSIDSSDLFGKIGVTTGSFMKHITFEPAKGKQRMLDLPAMMRNDLDMQVIDFMSETLESFETSYLEKLRKACETNQCIVTNLKCNQKGINMGSLDPQVRKEALRVYRESIDAAEILGARWIRPAPGGGKNPNRDVLIESYRELIEYAAPKKISILIENVGWVSRDPNVIPDIIKRVGPGLLASPDTGNWPDDETRFEGLAKAYPLAATSDFKVFAYEPDGSHPRYDVKKCFQSGWEAGFRGPWCIEHFHADLAGLIEGFGKIRAQLLGWIAAAKNGE